MPFAISPTLILYGLIVLAVGGYVWHCEAVKAENTKAAAIAEQQQIENAKKAFRDLKVKERSDENYELRIAALERRLRQPRASLLPAVTPAAGSPPTITFDHRQLDDALRSFDSGVAELVGEGEKAVIGLDEARSWARSIMP
jgi:hypothetical protein